MIVGLVGRGRASGLCHYEKQKSGVGLWSCFEERMRNNGKESTKQELDLYLYGFLKF